MGQKNDSQHNFALK